MAEIDVYKEWLGIPEGERPPDHYTLLRLVMFEDDPEKVNSNYRKLNSHVRKFATGQYLKPSQVLLTELAKAMLCLTDTDSKREYDASLGREAEEEVIDDEVTTTLLYLVSRGVITRGQITDIEHFADARGLSIRDAVIQMKLADQVEAAQALAAELRMQFVDLEEMFPEDNVLDGLPRNVVKRHTCLPLFEDGGRLLVACANEASPELEDEVRMRFGMPMKGVMAVPRQINQAIAMHYAPGTRTEAAAVGGSDRDSKAVEKKKKSAKMTDNASTIRKRKTPLTDEEKAHRRNISLIVLCWSIILPVVVMNTLTDTGGLMQAVITVSCAAVIAGGLKLFY
ncbi:MAG: general secretion pathway protein GspE [Fuerstiella sp.]|nr:general secretion pathway protein GspE [Fuerstiella sp.]